MTPYYQDNAVTIWHGDCREILPQLEPVDLVLITDPPYGLGIAANPFRQKFQRKQWDSERVDARLLNSLICRASKSIVWGGNYYDLPVGQCFFIWDKVQPENFSSAMCEMAWTNLEGPAKLFRRRVVGYYKEHPTEKPIELMRWCLGKVDANSTILDPFMGSGTTLRAAKDLGRKAIGIEIEEKYCEIAAKRMSQEVLDFQHTPSGEAAAGR